MEVQRHTNSKRPTWIQAQAVWLHTLNHKLYNTKGKIFKKQIS